jgi:type VI secretion system protein VasG
VDHILTRTLLPELSQEYLTRIASGRGIAAVHVSVNHDGAFHYKTLP